MGVGRMGFQPGERLNHHVDRLAAGDLADRRNRRVG